MSVNILLGGSLFVSLPSAGVWDEGLGFFFCLLLLLVSLPPPRSFSFFFFLLLNSTPLSSSTLFIYPLHCLPFPSSPHSFLLSLCFFPSTAFISTYLLFFLLLLHSLHLLPKITSLAHLLYSILLLHSISRHLIFYSSSILSSPPLCHQLFLMII